MFKNSFLEPSPEIVARFLKKHPDFLEHFLIEQIGLEELQRWVLRRIGHKKESEDAGR